MLFCKSRHIFSTKDIRLKIGMIRMSRSTMYCRKIKNDIIYRNYYILQINRLSYITIYVSSLTILTVLHNIQIIDITVRIHLFKKINQMGSDKTGTPCYNIVHFENILAMILYSITTFIDFIIFLRHQINIIIFFDII